MALLIKVLTFGAISAAIYLTIALVLIVTQQPSDLSKEGGNGGEGAAGGGGLDFQRQLARTDASAPLLSFTAPDGTALGYRRYESGKPSAPLLILVHGSGWHGEAFDPMARRIAEAGLADVVLPDLRGHGPNPERRGDLDYIGQFEDDLHALYLDQRKQDQKLILGGHSSGGGLVVRYAGGNHGSDLSGAVLLAPFLKYNAPTTRENSGGWAKAMTRRIIGLVMLNGVGISALNHLPVIDFAFPRSVLDGPRGQTATKRYSFRLNQSFAPRSDYQADLAKLPGFLLIAGRADEAFFADLYEPTITPSNGKGSYALIDDVSHLDVMYDDATFEAIKAYLEQMETSG